MTTDETLVKPKVKIKVFGVGGGGNSVLMRMGQHNELDIELYAVNTDAKQLQITAQVGGVNCIQIGENLTRGRGTGGNIQIGEQAAKNDAAKLQAAMNGADLVFVTAGMGGGTGTGAAPIVARLAKEMGILSVGVVTVPFAFEGNRKKKVAQEGITKMQSQMDALIAVENDNLSKLPENRKMSLVKAFECADNILKQAINCVAELILTTGVINVDFADVTTIFRQSESSDALLGIGVSERSAVDAVKIAAESPLIDKGLTGARGVILNLTGDSTLSLYDVDEATRYIVKHTDPEVNIILGTVEDNTMKGAVQATIIATDFADSVVMKAPTVKVPESAIKKETLQKETFQMEVPAFMNKDKKEEKPSQPFAIPAFKLTDLPDKDKQ
ncbi:cell division protein FtsZ [Selenomonas ruminantium]|uniref:Cell division protein FtsZ n=1 Tax=Selenomonas ruminantium TaxID=971 RepID=A0A1K1QUS5_SELRU|nr:cell division protein FtsZ [Selenomonas ruminantium]SFW63425.1 cell division protein FtsZ [Selenomonas ruminantium]